MLKWLVNKCGVSLRDAFEMLSFTPATVINEETHIGSIENGKKADIIILNDNLNVENFYLKGVSTNA